MDPDVRERQRQRSYPMLESRDEPYAVSPAELDAHMQAHRLLDDRLRSFERELADLRLERHDSEPVTLERSAGGRLVVKAKGAYAVALAVIALIAFGIWLWLR